MIIWKAKLPCPFRRKFEYLEELHGMSLTDFWQPSGAGMRRLLKVSVFHEEQDWFEYNKNIDVWMGTSVEKLS